MDCFGEMMNTQRATLLEPLLLNAEHTAHLLGISRSKLYSLHSAGQIPLPVRLAGCVRWDRAELQAWLLTKNPRTGLLPNRQQWLELRDRKDF